MADWGIRVLAWGHRKLGTRTILYVVLLTGMMTSVIVGLGEAVTGLKAQETWLWFFSFLGVLTGWWLCRKEISLWLGAFISGLSGFAMLLVYSGGLLPYFWSLARAAILIIWMRVIENSVSQSAISALSFIWQELLNGASAILDPLKVWIMTLGSGNPEFNEAAAIFIWSLVIWLLAIWGSWGIRRYENPILATLPAGVVLGGALSYVGGDAKVLILFVGCLLLLMSLTSHYLRERRWQALPLPFSEELRFDVSGWSIFITLSLMLAALILPNLSIRNLISWIESSGGQGSQSQKLVDPVSFGDALGLVANPSPIPPSAFDVARTPGLPRKHLLGSGPELGEQVVMVVSVEDPVPQAMARYYWKSLTYDQYNGQGWETGETREIRYSEGEVAFSEISANQRIIRQTISASEHLGGLVFASGTLVTVNRDFVVAWRDTGDEMVDQFGAVLPETRYKVDSAVATIGVSQLRESDGNIPGWVSNGYLALPDTIPERVIQLAHQLVENQSNPYGKALAIEEYLRTYPYNLNIEVPPAGKDVADYFLFDLRQGYCDYYATAMVVLARTVGLPARLAVGYASGIYDRANQRYIVTAADAHSWVEIYFPEFGWIPFEPTAGQPALEREEFLPEIPQDLNGKLNPFPSKWARLVRLGSIVLGGGVILLIIGFGIWWKMDDWLLSRKPPQEAIAVIFQNIYRSGRRFGFTPGSELTPYEYTARLNLRIAGLISRLGRKSINFSLFEKMQTITRIYVKSIYGPEIPDIGLQKEAIQIWRTLRWQFWWLWLRSRLASSIKINFNSDDTHKMERV